MQHTLEEHPETEKENLVAQINSWNDQLESAVNHATNRAFNLGCFMGIFPAFALILVTYFLAGKSWLGAVVMLVLMSLALVLFANGIAGITRQNTLKRFYQENIHPEIEQALQRHPMDQSDFAAIAAESLPPGSDLLTVLSQPDDPNELLNTENAEVSGKQSGEI